jgi:hypothetical protein
MRFERDRDLREIPSSMERITTRFTVNGILTKDLIIANGNHKDNYQELLSNLIISFELSWRLKRVLRFETGSIRKANDRLDVNLFNGNNKDCYSLPDYTDSERAMRYDRAPHKSIMPNILMLKKLQSI